MTTFKRAKPERFSYKWVREEGDACRGFRPPYLGGVSLVNTDDDAVFVLRKLCGVP